MAERTARDTDERVLTGLKGGSISQYLVLVEPAIGYEENTNQNNNQNQESKKDYSPRSASAIPISSASATSIPLSSFGTSATYSTTTSSITTSPTSSTTTSSTSKLTNGKSSYDKKIEDLFWNNVDTSPGGGKTKNIYSSVTARRNDFYSEFKAYVEKRIEKGIVIFFMIFFSKLSCC